jgi:hypothetical protein
MTTIHNSQSTKQHESWSTHVQVLQRQSLKPTHLPQQLLISLPTKEGGVLIEMKQVGTGKEQLSPVSPHRLFDEWHEA